MEKRKFGNTGLAVSRLTFGCGAVGGLMDQRRVHAIRIVPLAGRVIMALIFSIRRQVMAMAFPKKILAVRYRATATVLVISTKVGLSNDDLADVLWCHHPLA